MMASGHLNYESAKSVAPIPPNEYDELKVSSTGEYYNIATTAEYKRIIDADVKDPASSTRQTRQGFEIKEAVRPAGFWSRWKVIACILGSLLVVTVGVIVLLLILYLNKEGPCPANYCNQNGKCVIITQGSVNHNMSCVCDPGYAGKYCETAASDSSCPPGYCRGHGNCLTISRDGNPHNISCVCDSGFTGDHCQISANDPSCPPGYCRRHGNCLTISRDGNPHNVSCVCDSGFTGDHCETSIVDGWWTEWGAWSECSVTCGSGIRGRSRTCTNPRPAHGGSRCPGELTEDLECLSVTCKEPIHLYVTCDDHVKVYIDSQQTPFLDSATGWGIVDHVVLPHGTKVVGLECRDTAQMHVGIIASLTNGMVTDSSWLCSGTLESGWNSVEFMPNSTWEGATELTTVGQWGNAATNGGVLTSAKWIWTSRFTFPNIDTPIYCRKTLS